jgi:hypothetical protein
MDPSELLALKNLWRMCQAARDAYGPAEDYLVSMENRLEAEEAKLDQIEERLYQKLDLSRPAPTVKSPLEDQDKEVSKDENNDESSRQSSHESRSADQNDFENYLWRLRNLDLLHGRYHGLLNEKSILEEEKLNRRRVGMELDTEYIEVLDHFEEILEPERKEIKDVAEDVECLKKLCIEKGFMDADGNPIQPLATDQAPGSDSVEDVQAERLPEYIMPSQHQEPLRHDEMDSRVLISNEGFGPFINLWPLHKLRSSTMEMLLLACYVAPSVHNMDGLKWQAEAFRLWERDSVMKEVPGEIYDAVESNMSPSIHRYVEEKTKRDEGKKALVELATYADCYIMRIRLGYHEKGWIISTWNTKSAFYVASPVRFLNHFERGLVLAACIQFIDGAAALPTGPLPETGNARTSIGFTGFWKTKAKQFTDETAGPLLLNMCLILVLTVVHVIIMRLHRGLCKDWDLLLTSMIATSLGLVFLAMVESLSGWQVAM